MHPQDTTLDITLRLPDGIHAVNVSVPATPETIDAFNHLLMQGYRDTYLCTGDGSHAVVGGFCDRLHYATY